MRKCPETGDAAEGEACETAHVEVLSERVLEVFLEGTVNFVAAQRRGDQG